jgi:hypothetical protein
LSEVHVVKINSGRVINECICWSAEAVLTEMVMILIWI